MIHAFSNHHLIQLVGTEQNIELLPSQVKILNSKKTISNLLYATANYSTCLFQLIYGEFLRFFFNHVFLGFRKRDGNVFGCYS